MTNLFEPTPYSTWKHLKTNSTYTVLGISTDSTNDAPDPDEKYVVYISHTNWTIKHRKLSEFVDGRFEPVVVGITG